MSHSIDVNIADVEKIINMLHGLDSAELTCVQIELEKEMARKEKIEAFENFKNAYEKIRELGVHLYASKTLYCHDEIKFSDIYF